jgi:hypothetical protein
MSAKLCTLMLLWRNGIPLENPTSTRKRCIFAI